MNSLLKISESEKNKISRLHKNAISNESITIVEWLSPDEKYCIFLDDLIDIENKKKIGNVFENFDNFRFFLKHCYQTASHLNEELRESLLESVNSFVITESNSDIRGLRPYVKQMIIEQEWTSNPFKKEFYSSQNWNNAYQSGKKTVESGIEGLKTAYSNIKDGDWKTAISIIGKGALYVAKKIRSALYTPIGIVLDAILIAISAGGAKIPLTAVWCIVIMLDLYEFSTGNYEEPNMGMGWRLLNFGTDIIGLVTTAFMAKGAKATINAAKTTFGSTDDALRLAAQRQPKLKGLLQKMLNSTSSASNVFKKGVNNLKTNSPKMYNFFKGVISIFDYVLNKLIDTLTYILKLKFLTAPGKGVEKLVAKKIGADAAAKSKTVIGTAAAANQVVPMAGIHAYGEYKTNKTYDMMYKALENSNIESIYDKSQI